MSSNAIQTERTTYYQGETVTGEVVGPWDNVSEVHVKFSSHEHLNYKLTSDSAAVSHKVLLREVFKVEKGTPFAIQIPSALPGSLEFSNEKFQASITHRLQAILKFSDGQAAKINLPLTVLECVPQKLEKSQSAKASGSERVGRSWLCFKPLKGWKAEITTNSLVAKSGDTLKLKVHISNTSKYPVGPFYVSFVKKMCLVTAIEVVSHTFGVSEKKIEPVAAYSEFDETLELEVPAELQSPSYGFHSQLVYCVGIRHESSQTGSFIPVHLASSLVLSGVAYPEAKEPKLLHPCYGIRLKNFPYAKFN